jgi:hypothetical protein
MGDARRDGDASEPAPSIEESAPRDVLLAVAPTTDGEGASVLRLRDGRVETGELRAAREGQPILGELVTLKQRPEHASLYDVEVVATGPVAAQARAERSADDETPRRERAAPALPHKGPALVNSDAYREGWDALFGAPRRGKALPS